jgi:hypothetical protein
MAIKIGGTTVIDNSRSLTNIQNITVGSAGISGGALSISANSSESALAITQEGTGPSLVVETQAGSSNPPFVINADGKVNIGEQGLSTIPSTTNLLINAGNTTSASMGFRNLGVTFNTVFGHSISLENGRLHIKGRTDNNFTETYDTVSAITIGTDNKVGIRTDVPGYNLDVRGETRALATNNDGLLFQPNAQAQAGRHVISGANTDNGFLRAVSLGGEIISFNTGTGTTANQRFAIDSTGNSSFPGSLTANLFRGPGVDWSLLSRATFTNTTSQALLDFGTEGYNSFCLIFENVNIVTDGVFALQLYDSTLSTLGGSTYSSIFFTNYTFASGVNIQAPLGTFWYVTPYNIFRNSSTGSMSGRMMFYDMKSTTSRWKKVTAEIVHNYSNGGADTLIMHRSAHTVDIPTTGTQPAGVALLGTDLFFSGKISFYGIR